MIKKCLKLFSFVLLSSLLLLGVTSALNVSKTAKAEIVIPDATKEFFEIFTFTSDNMVYDNTNFVVDDLIKKTLPMTNKEQQEYAHIGALYANTNITLHINTENLINKYTNRFSLKFIKAPTILSICPYDYENYNTETNQYAQGTTDDSIFPNKENTKNNFVFQMNYNKPTAESFHVQYSYQITENIDEHTNKTETITRNFTFYIIQQTTNFTKSNPVSYVYKDSTEKFHKLPAMRTDSKINANNVKVRIPHGTVLNPIYIKFIHNGEEYLIYNIKGTFYNSLDNKVISELTNSSSSGIFDEDIIASKILNKSEYLQGDNESTLMLNISGYYKIEIYDKAYLHTKSNSSGMKNPNANLITDSFNLSTQAQEVYLVVETADGTQVANGQTTNNDIIAKLHNAGSGNVSSITIDHKDANERNTAYVIKNWLQQSTIKKEGPIKWGLIRTDESGNNTNSFVQFQLLEDGLYKFTIKYIDSTIENFQYVVQIVKGIRKSYSYTDENNHTTTYNPSGDNKIETKTLSKTFNLNYGYGITNIYTNTYTVRIANSNPSITGINNNGSRNGDVTLTIRGVGDITVVVNGVKQPGTIQNGGKITLTDSGNYNVKITDALGVSKDINFTIGIKMNTASVALIVVGALLVAGVIFFIMKNRGRAKVK